MTQGRQTREFNFVGDLVEGFVLAAQAPGVDGEVINLGSEQEISMADLARTLLHLLGDPVVAELGSLPDRPNEIWRMRADATKARDLLGWTPQVDLAKGLRRTVDWYRGELANPAGSVFSP